MALPQVQDCDVAIVGAGPAGCSAALPLADAGVRVLLIEKARLPRYKTCGGGLLRRAFRLLPPVVAQAVERECGVAELNFVRSNLRFVTTRPEPVVFMTMRAELDQLLAREAVSAGAELRERCEVESFCLQNDRVKLQTTRGTISAKFAIAADGANSVVASQAGWQAPRKLIPAVEYELGVNAEDWRRLSCTARFDFEVIEAGYAWVFPKRAHLSVGVLSTRRGAINLHATLNEYLAWLGIREVREVERHGYLIPLAPRPGPLARGRVLLAGDAAGLADPVTAEGITHAIRSGQLAAEALRYCNLDETKVARAYQSRLAEAILPELRAARLLAAVLYGCPRICRRAFRRHGQALSELVTDVVTGDRSYRGELGRIGNYRKLLGRARPG